MSCSGEIVAENDLLQIKPAVTKKLKKAKYGIADHSTVSSAIGQKNHSEGRKLLQAQVLRNIKLMTMHWNFQFND